MPEDDNEVHEMEEGERDRVVVDIKAGESGPAGGGDGPGGGPAAMSQGQGAAGEIGGAPYLPGGLIDAIGQGAAGPIGEGAAGPVAGAAGDEGDDG